MQQTTDLGNITEITAARVLLASPMKLKYLVTFTVESKNAYVWFRLRGTCVHTSCSKYEEPLPMLGLPHLIAGNSTLLHCPAAQTRRTFAEIYERQSNVSTNQEDIGAFV